MNKKAPANESQRFGRYVVLNTLGKGGMATVYLAEDPSLNRMVAVKVIHAHLTNNLNLLERFTIEAKTAAGLRNPNIVEIFDYGVEDGAQYLVMEYINGPNLQYVLNMLQGQVMHPDTAAALVCQAAEGLIAAEKNNVVHRDIKPENLMLSSEGVLKIADFGIAHISEQNLTQTGSILGSPSFMSPEQIEGRKPSHQTDMFSLGAVFYSCLTGKKPFIGPNIPTIMRNICDMPHPPMAETISGLDPILENLVETLLHKEPENRGKGARWLSLQLRAYLNGKGILDLTETTKALLDEVGKINDQTFVDSAAPPASPQSTAAVSSGEGKAPLKPGLKVEKEKPRAPSLSTSHTVNRIDAGDAPTSGIGSPPTFRLSRMLAGKGVWIGAIAGAFVLLTIVILILRAVGGKSASPASGAPSSTQVTLVELQPMSMELDPGQTRSLLARVLPPEADASVRWESSDSAVATVVQGVVSAKIPGRADIRAISLRDGTKQGLAEVTVTGAKRSGKARAASSSGTGGQQASASSAGAAGAKASAEKCVLTINSAPPFADVVMDGHPLGTTPIKGKKVPVGRHTFKVNHPSVPGMDTVITLEAGERTLKFKLFQ